MTTHRILTAADHGALRVAVAAGARYGDAVMSAVTVPAEFRRLACDYPILFRHDTEQQAFAALALLGFEPGENLFLDGDRWDASIRPLAMAVQPFLVGRPRQGEGATQVHIDMAHPRVVHGADGEALFDPQGQPTAFLDNAASMLAMLDDGWRRAGDFFAALKRHDLLEPFSMDVTLDDGAMHRLVGYHLIAEERLAALEPTVLAELHAAGHLQPIFMAIASLGNLGKLVQRRKRRLHG